MTTGHIRKRVAKDGKISYQIIVESEKDPLTGKRQRQYATVNGTKKEAQATLDRMKAEINGGGIVTAPSAMKLRDWLREWLKLYLPNIEATTRAGYTERIDNRIIPYLGNFPLKALQTPTIQQWVTSLHKDVGLSPKSIKNIFLNLRAALDKAVLLGMIPRNPCTGVVLPNLVKYQAEVYDDQEIKDVLKAAENSDMYLLVALSVTIGFRRGELVALTWDDIDFNESIIHIRKNKVIAGKEKVTKAPKSAAGIRDIGFGDSLKSLLEKEYSRYQADKLAMGADFVDSNCVIRQKNGKSFSPDSITQKWIRFCEANNLKRIRLHDLRHTCATAMVSSGIDQKTVQTRMGHANINITLNTYAHCLPSTNKEAGQLMDKRILGDR